MNIPVGRPIADDDNSLSSGENEYNNLGEKLVRATKFLGTIVKGGQNGGDSFEDPNLDVDRCRLSMLSTDGEKVGHEENTKALSKRYTEANEGNLYKCLRSVRHTNDGMGGSHAMGLQHDELSFDSGEGSQMSMPRIDESGGEDDESKTSRGDYEDSDAPGDGKPVVIIPTRGNLHKQASDITIHSRRASNGTQSSAIRRRDELYHRSSDVSNRSLPSSVRWSKDAADSHFSHDNNETTSRRGSAQESLASSGTPRLFRAILGRDSDGSRRQQSRRSSSMSVATDDSGEDDNKIRRWFGIGAVEKISSSFTTRNSSQDLKGLAEEESSVTDNGSVSGSAHRNGSGPITSGADTTSMNPSFTSHHARSRANFMKRNVHHAASERDLFRDLQRRMKEKGAITGSAVRHLLQETAEEHAVDNRTGGMCDLDSHNDESIDLSSGCLDETESLKKTMWSSASFNDNAISKYLRRGSQNDDMSNALQQHEERQQRLEQDPLFGKNTTTRPYIALPSRKSRSEMIMDILCDAADQGENRLLTVRGPRFVGKSRLIKKAIDTVQIQGLGYTVLSSSRSANDALTSFYCFREITSAALRACDAVTDRSDESLNDNRGENADDDDEDNDESIVQRLVQRKILNKSDQLMIGRILPAVINNQLLSLLKGRNPAALVKDIAASLFKIMIPLQPVVLVFEADGDDCNIDSSSWYLIEELLLSAGKQCPQMLMIAVSRLSMCDDVPTSIADKHVDLPICPMDNAEDTESYIRALFCDPAVIDRNMQVDPLVVNAVYDRAQGCPLFTERIVLWSQRKGVFELDETRNSVSLNLSNAERDDRSMLETLPTNLNEEILEVINILPDNLLEALKVASCLGISFDLGKYTSLRDEGLNHSLQEMTNSYGIFEETKGCYKWKHTAVYEAVESIIISNERIEIQSRIAYSLRDLPTSHRGDAQYARHYAMAEQWDEAFDRYMEAGQKAEETLDFVGAVGMYQQAKVCLPKSPKKPSLRRKLSPHAALGWCLREMVRYDEAEMELEYCLKHIMSVPERKRNSQFKEMELDVVTTLATLKQAQSKYSEAMTMYERALPIARANKEKHTRVWLAHHVSSCAEIHRKSGDLEQAKTLHTEALGYRELAVEEHSCTVLELALSFTQLGCTLSGLGDHSRAYTLHKKALAARMEHLDFYHSLVSESLNYSADALQALGRGAEGIPLGMHAVKIRKFVFGPLHPAYAHALSVLASCYHSVGRSFDSLGLLKECLEICEKAFSKNHANMIPNLMTYGSVLSVSGNVEKAADVYERALNIHRMNFKEGQNAKQLEKLEKAIDLLHNGPQAKQKASLDMPIPVFEPESSKTHVLVCADIGQRASDEYMLSVAASLQKMGTIKLVAFVAVSQPQVVRADMARGALDSLLLSDVPVAYSGVVSSASSSRVASAATFNADYGKPSPHVNNTGVELITRALLKASEKSLVIMCTACLGDVSEVIDSHRDLFAKKVKQVVIIGSVKAVKRKSMIEPEESGQEKEDAFAKNVYQSCQELEIPTVTLFKDVSRGFPFPSSHVDDLASSNHMIATKVQRSEEMQMNGIWELIKQLRQEARSYRTPKSLDIKSFYKYILGGKNPPISQHNIWPSIASVNLELVLGLLCCSPIYQDAHFRWESHQVNGIEHKVCRHSNSAAGIIKPESLSNEIHMLVGFSLRASLLNTSC